MKRPFADRRPFGPFLTAERISFSSSKTDMVEERDWESMSTDTLDAPPDWDWTVDDKLAHHVWTLTSESRFVNFGPSPPILLEAFMGFSKNKSMTASINNWYFTRKTDRQYSEESTWWLIGTKFQDPSGDPGDTSTVYSPVNDPHPLRSVFHSQQYTVNGAMFTYELSQWQGDSTTGFIRVPVPTDSQVLTELRSDVEDTPFEEFQFQTRQYSNQFSTGPAPQGTYAHPHFRPENSGVTQEDYIDFFNLAFDYMERGVRAES